jgi:hypothetical protein
MKLTIKLAVAALAATALTAPSAALAGGKAHLLGSYKVEKHIDLEGEEGFYDISCPGSDIAVDGMWRIDNVDQDNDYVYDPAPTGQARHDVLLSVEPVAAYPTTKSTYRFQFVPLAGANVQGKLFLTCLPDEVTKVSGHTHKWIVDGTGATENPYAGAPALFPAPGGGTTYRNVEVTDTSCSSPDEIAIAPGFKWEPDVGPPAIPEAWGKPWKRFPTSTHNTQGWAQWNWGFFTSTGGNLTLYHNCLERLTGWKIPGGGHRHKVAAVSKLTTIAGNNLKKNQVSEAQVECGEHYKAMLGAWDFGYFGYVWNGADYWKKLWYLGMDPRPKVRAFKVLNTDPLVDVFPIPLGMFAAYCWKTKTT